VFVDPKAVLIDLTHRVTAETKEAADKYLFWSDISSNVVMPFLFNNLTEIQAINAPVFGFLGSALTLISGTQNLSNKWTHRPIITQIKGLMNVLSGLQNMTVQCLLLTGFAVLGPPALAVSAGIQFALSLDDTLYAYRRLDHAFWLADTQAVMAKNEQRLAELSQLISTSLDKKTQQMYREKWYQLIENQTQLSAQVHDAKHERFATIDQQNNDKLYHAFTKSFILGMLFIGAVLLCIPGLQMPGLIVMMAAVGLFIVKHAANLRSKGAESSVSSVAFQRKQQQVLQELLDTHGPKPDHDLSQ
jgi:hypothetical protein